MARGKKSSSIKTGRMIGEKRERLETANERAAARKKDKQKSAFRIFLTVFGFILVAAILIALYVIFVLDNKEKSIISSDASVEETFTPTIEIVDEDAAATGGKITTRMTTYIGQAESDFRDLGYTPVRAVIPANSIREVDFYLDGHPGFIKMTIDRGTAVSVEDADRMLRYLSSQGISTFSYIDVRVANKAFWKE